ncbi:hypothetical protein [Marinivivus vitaminiproducens]|uniref:hypothetical protein n=1 Tax=Marinivivus vitaminiproducens TaxID=3035935 RepID=UPI0027A560A5|nr:hypothetical protein P4R82_05820 [Geminicoccaceae bacterium SCSIO 64248]
MRRPPPFRPATALLMLALAGCSTAAMDEPVDLAVACQTDAALAMARRSAAGDNVVGRAMGAVAELAILKEAGRMTAYRSARARMLAQNDYVTEADVEEAVDVKVGEMRTDRQAKLGRARC